MAILAQVSISWKYVSATETIFSLTNRTVVVAQLVEQSLPIPEVRGSNPVIGKKYIEHLLSTVIKNTKIKKIEGGNGSFFKKAILIPRFGLTIAVSKDKNVFFPNVNVSQT